MKRQSKAEEALNKQIKVISSELNFDREKARDLQIQIRTKEAMRQQLEEEVARMQRAKIMASDRAKP